MRPSLSFSLRNVLRREYNGVYAVVVVLAVLDLVGAWRAEHQVVAHARWAWMFSVASLLWIVAITIKRRTKWLNVEGR